MVNLNILIWCPMLKSKVLTTGDSLMASSLAVLTQSHPIQGSTEEAVLYSNKFSTNSYSGYPVTTTSLNLSWKLLTNPSLEKPMHRLRPSARLSNLPGNPLISLNFTSLQLLLANALLWIPSLCYLMNDFFSRSWNISQEEATKNSLSWRTFVLLDLSRERNSTPTSYHDPEQRAMPRWISKCLYILKFSLL